MKLRTPIIKRFQKADSGATAVEFALILPLLVLIFMAILEVSLMFFATVNLDGAAIEAARRIRTGQTQQTANPETDFTTTLCTQLNTMMDCADLFYDSRTMASYSTISLAVTYDSVTGEPDIFGFATGGAGDIVVVRVMYLWPIQTPMLATLFETVAGTNNRLLTSTVVFQNEPYE